METIISAIKIISMLATGAFGVLGLITNYKDESGKITKWGKVALSGVVLSAVLSLFLYGLEASRAKVAAKEAQDKAEATTRVLTDILSSAKITLAKQEISLDKTVQLESGLEETLKGQKENSQRTISISEDMDVALEQQRESLLQSRDITRSMATSLDTQRTLLAAQGRVQRQVVRAYYPLEPLTIFYEVEYPMNQPGLDKYADRVRADIVRYLREARSGSGRVTSDDLRDEEVQFILTNQEGWKPGDAPGEKKAKDVLLRRATMSFKFKEAAPGTKELVFRSVPPDLQDMFVSLPSKGRVKQQIELVADFSRQIFVQKVRCETLTRAGNDRLSMSAIDLVGRNLTWDTVLDLESIWQLRSFALKFPYDYEDSTHIRRTAVSQATKQIQITANHLGLTEVLADTNVFSKR